MAKQVNEIENLKGLIDDLERQVLALKAENRELKDQIEKLEQQQKEIVVDAKSEPTLIVEPVPEVTVDKVQEVEEVQQPPIE